MDLAEDFTSAQAMELRLDILHIQIRVIILMPMEWDLPPQHHPRPSDSGKDFTSDKTEWTWDIWATAGIESDSNPQFFEMTLILLCAKVRLSATNDLRWFLFCEIILKDGIQGIGTGDYSALFLRTESSNTRVSNGLS